MPTLDSPILPLKELLNEVISLFPKEDPATVLELLDYYGKEPYERERHRVQKAILKISGGDADKLLEFIIAAKRDYRDVLMWAENASPSPAEAAAMLHSVASMLQRSGYDSEADALLRNPGINPGASRQDPASSRIDGTTGNRPIDETR